MGGTAVALVARNGRGTMNMIAPIIGLKTDKFRRIRSVTLITTYCCSATACYFVPFPAIWYEGYFEKKDVVVSQYFNN